MYQSITNGIIALLMFDVSMAGRIRVYPARDA
jgi:hypothetical protein